MLLFLKVFAFRLLAVFIVRSWFVPDELFQSVEVAHHWLFGSGHLTWEWSKDGLRSALHPLICVIALLPFKILGFLSPSIVFWIPRIEHAFLFALGDCSFVHLSRRFYSTNHNCARFTNLLYFSNWFLFYCSPRTLANSVETALTLIALRWFPFEGIRQSKTAWPYMTIGAISIIIRPTAAIIWAIFGLSHLYHSKERIRVLIVAILTVIPIFAIALLIDSLFYGRPTFALYNFLSFNVFQGGSALFGVHPWWWYLSEGFPALLHLQMLPLLMISLGCLPERAKFRFPTTLPLWTSLVYVLIHSALPHKEHRFLLPILPLLILYTGPFALLRNTTIRRAITALILIGNICVSIYFSLWHQVGPYSAASFILRDSLVAKSRVMTLMPCFSMPEYAYFHNQLATFRSLDCSPPLHLSNGTLEDGWLDEADRFHEDPLTWVHAHRKELSTMTHLVLYEAMYRLLEAQLWELGFSECFRSFHAHILTSSRQDHHIVIACHNRPARNDDKGNQLDHSLQQGPSQMPRNRNFGNPGVRNHPQLVNIPEYTNAQSTPSWQTDPPKAPMAQIGSMRGNSAFVNGLSRSRTPSHTSGSAAIARTNPLSTFANAFRSAIAQPQPPQMIGATRPGSTIGYPQQPSDQPPQGADFRGPINQDYDMPYGAGAGAGAQMQIPVSFKLQSI
ncbi:unnamed protein product, partial [Mesorhabditis belari]|uniref:Mannosyltransferase n=1 Tax=Mesorhabditis belari TaxID=2138241 RepID=A0AAF3F594_9BILA